MASAVGSKAQGFQTFRQILRLPSSGLRFRHVRKQSAVTGRRMRDWTKEKWSRMVKVFWTLGSLKIEAMKNVMETRRPGKEVI
jgi:hypothetical protein